MPLPSFSPRDFAPEDLPDPYPVYASYRSAEPVHRADDGTWFVFGYDDVASVLSAKDFGRNAPAHLPDRHAMLRRMVENWLVFMDPPRHTHLRRVLASSFTAKVVTGLRSRIGLIAQELLSEPPRDFVADFAAPYPVLVISELLGIPRSLRDWFRSQAVRLQEASSGRTGERADGFSRADDAARELAAYFTAEVRRRRSAPSGDLVSLLAHSEGLTDDEIAGTCVHLLTAGHETTTNLLGKSLLALLANPAVVSALLTSPALVPAAVDELVRYDPPVQMVTRWAIGTQVVGGEEIRCGDKVVLVLGSANRDPARFPAPDELRLDRDPPRHSGFGLGIHYCLGASLARAEAEIALRILLPVLHEFRVDDVSYAGDLVFHGPDRVLVTRNRAGRTAPVRPAR